MANAPDLETTETASPSQTDFNARGVLDAGRQLTETSDDSRLPVLSKYNLLTLSKTISWTSHYPLGLKSTDTI